MTVDISETNYDHRWMSLSFSILYWLYQLIKRAERCRR